MELTTTLLNDGLKLTLEFGENWLCNNSNRLSEKFPSLTQVELNNCTKLFRSVNTYAHDFIRKNPLKKGNDFTFIDFDHFEAAVLTKYEWINVENLEKLYSQSCYYALK